MVLADTTAESVNGPIAIIAAVIPIVLGGVTAYFKLFLVSKKDFRRRTQLKRSGLREKIATRLAALLQHVRSLGPDDTLRGDGRENADLVGDYTEENFRLFTVYHRLAFLENIIRHAYLFLYLTVVFGLVGFFLALLLPITRPWVLAISIGIVGTQVVTVLMMLFASWKLDDYEDIV